MKIVHILLGLLGLILWYIAKFKRKTIINFNDRTILDRDKLINSLSLLYLITGLAMICLGLVEIFEVVSNQDIINKAFSTIILVTFIMNGWVTLKYSNPKSK